MRVDGVQELQDADDFVFVILHRHGQERARAVAGGLVEFFGAGKVEALGTVGVGNVDRFDVQRSVGSDQRVVRLAIFQVQRQILELGRNRRAGGAAKSHVQRIGADDHEAQEAAILTEQVERAAVGVGDGLGREQDAFQQAVDVPLVRQRRADGVELFEALKQIGWIFHATSYLIQTERTCLRSVMPESTFSIPSILSVRMPSFSAVAKSSATRACS